MVARSIQVPDRGEYVWVEFSPQRGREIAKRRPALVLSPRAYNARVGLALVIPVTSQEKGYAFEVPAKGKKISGAILVDQIRSIDIQSRIVGTIEKATPKTVRSVQEKLLALIVD